MSRRGRENVRLLNLSNGPGEDFFFFLKRLLAAYEKEKNKV
jgi:hypothetical protein